MISARCFDGAARHLGEAVKRGFRFASGGRQAKRRIDRAASTETGLTAFRTTAKEMGRSSLFTAALIGLRPPGVR